jgi:hypothetical protein
LEEQALPQVGERLFADAAQPRKGHVGNPRGIAAEDLSVERGDDGADELSRRDLPPAQPVAIERRGGVAGHQGAVEVEEGPHLRTARTGLDRLDRSLDRG